MSGSAPVNILTVDDDLGLLRLVERALKREDFITATASSGREAIAWLTQNNADLMLLDLKLEEIEGKELINHLAGIGRLPPFIVITGQGDERVAVEMMKRGALDYLVKDSQFIQFVPTVVRRALEQVQKDKQLVAAQVALKQSQEQLLAISEREQMRIGTELHDGLGQELTALELMCQSLKEDLRSKQPKLENQASEIGRLLREAIAQTRSLARGLSPVNLDSTGLADALAELARRTIEYGRVKCTLDCPQPVLIEDSTVARHLFRIAQEAVNNAVKHAKARNLLIKLATEKGAVHLVISDNGKGLPKKNQTAQGIGLQVMKHRAGVIGAELNIDSKPGGGVTVTCNWQMDKP